MLVDSARAMAEALVVRQGTEPDPHWNDKSVQVICAVLVLVLLKFKEEDRNLSSVQEIVSDPEMLRAAANIATGDRRHPRPGSVTSSRRFLTRSRRHSPKKGPACSAR